MNHLRELMEALPWQVGADECFQSPEELLRSLTEAKRIGELAMCFSMGDIDDTCRLAVIPELCRLPYRHCWFEAEFGVAGDAAKRIAVGMLATDDDGRFSASMFSRQPGARWSLEGTVSADTLQTPYMQFQAIDVARAGIQTMTYGVQAFLSALHCSNVRRHENAPDAKLQKARAKRGKAPLFSYWTLQLDGKSERGEDQGGTHASPRVHLRRGHPRQYAAGKWTWVQACAVGNRASGMVHKDYSAGPALMAAAL